MADAARWIAAAEPATGFAENSMIEALRNCQTERIIDRTGNDVIGSPLLAMLLEGPFEGTAADLLVRLKPEYPPRYFPDTPLKLSKHLDRIRTGLALMGVTIDRLQRSKKGNPIRIWKDGQENDRLVPSEPRGFVPY